MILDATAPHTRVDNFVIDDYGDRIGAYGLAVYMVIKRHYNWLTGQCTPSYNRIAQMCGISRSTVIRYVKRLKFFGLIDPQMRFTDEGQTSNQYGFYQPKRPKKPNPPTPVSPRLGPPPEPEPAQESTTAQASTTAQVCNPVSQGHSTDVMVTSDQVVLEQKEERRNAKDMPKEEEKTEKTAPKGKTEKQQQCPHPYAEVVTMFDGTTICNHCYDLLEFLPDAQAA